MFSQMQAPLCGECTRVSGNLNIHAHFDMVSFKRGGGAQQGRGAPSARSSSRERTTLASRTAPSKIKARPMRLRLSCFYFEGPRPEEGWAPPRRTSRISRSQSRKRNTDNPERRKTCLHARLHSDASNILALCFLFLSVKWETATPSDRTRPLWCQVMIINDVFQRLWGAPWRI